MFADDTGIFDPQHVLYKYIKDRTSEDGSDLGAKLIKQKELTKESAKEQASAGLNNLDLEDINTFLNLNKRYIEKHRFPFIIAAKGRTKHSILKAFKERIDNPTELEFVEACTQVELIAYLRIKDILDKDT